MDWAIDLLITLTTTIHNYFSLVSFLAPFLAADFGILLMGFLSAQNLNTTIIPIIFCSLGLIVLDSGWFLIIKSKWIHKFKKKYFTKKFIKIEKQIEQISHNKDQWILFISKFLVGTRALIIIYISSKEKLTYRQFLKYDLIASSLWVTLLTTIGWFAGQGFFALKNAYNGLKIAALFLIIVMIGIYFIKKVIKHFLITQKL